MYLIYYKLAILLQCVGFRFEGQWDLKTQNIIAILSYRQKKTYLKITLIGEPNWFGSFVSSVVKF